MKKTTTIMSIAAAALLISSCSKNETSNGSVMPSDTNKIGFSSFTGSRATDNNLASLQADVDGFKVIATTSPSDTEADYFIASYKYTAGPNTWDWAGNDDPKYSWPADTDLYPMNFVSLYPKDDALSFAAPTKAISIEAKIDKQIDYIRAKGTAAAKPTTGKVDMAFAHILSKIAFKFDVAVGYKANIQSVKVVNVQDQTANTGAAPTYDVFTGTWTNALTATPTNVVSYGYRTVGAGGTNTDNAVQSIDALSAAVNAAVENNSKGTLMLLPQYGTANWDAVAFATAAAAQMKAYRDALTGEETLSDVDMSGWETVLANEFKGTRIEVVYNLEKTSADNYAVGAAGKFVRVGYVLDLNAASAAWASGKMYTYTISLGGDATGGILLDPFYTKADGTPTNNPADVVDTPKIDPGNPINNTSRIGFNVSVGLWNETDGAKPIK